MIDARVGALSGGTADWYLGAPRAPEVRKASTVRLGFTRRSERLTIMVGDGRWVVAEEAVGWEE